MQTGCGYFSTGLGNFMDGELKDLTGSADRDSAFALGEWMGRRQAFGLIAGKAAAADVECLRRIRDEKLYRAKADDWDGYCRNYVGVTRSYADRLIRQLEEFGPNYFHLSQLARISADAYRQIAGSVDDDGIRFGGEKIAIIPENSQKLIEAVNALRTESGGGGRGGAKLSRKGVAKQRERLEASIAEMNRMLESGLAESEREELAAAVEAGMRELKLLSLLLT